MEVNKDARLNLVSAVCFDLSSALKEYGVRHMGKEARYCQECHLGLTNKAREIITILHRGHVRDAFGKIMHVEVKDAEGA